MALLFYFLLAKLRNPCVYEIWVSLLDNLTLVHVNSKCADQTVKKSTHLISASVIHLMERMIFKLASCSIQYSS